MKKRIYFIINIILIFLYVTVGILGIPEVGDVEGARNLIIGYYVIGALLITILTLLNWNVIKKDFRKYFKKPKKYIFLTLKYFIFGLIAYSVARFSTILIVDAKPSGTNLISNAFQVFPLYVTFVTIIYTPFVEEIVFRKILKDLIPVKWLFIVLSGCIFGFFHIIGDFSNILEFIALFAPISSFGIVIAYAYRKTNNIFVSIFIHLIYNSFLFLFLL